MAARRRFGRVRKLPSGRWQARYKGPDGIDRPAPRTFITKRDAEVWLSRTEADILDDEWLDPDLGQVLFGDYARSWIDERPGLRPKTIQLYRYLLRRHLNPAFEARPIASTKEQHVRRWRKQLLDGGASPVTTAKAYRLLRAIFATAVDDGIVRRNPCRIKGAGQEKSPERPVLTISQVYAVADAIGPRYRAMILLAVFASLRWGELTALRRCDIDLNAGIVQVTRQVTEISSVLSFGPPKSAAGVRTVIVPDVILPELAWHISRFTASGDDSLLFTGLDGSPLRHSQFRRRPWLPALAAAGVPPVHFHDLRHTGNDLAVDAGASLRELMHRMGHSTPSAALGYLHSKDERQQAIADAISKRTASELRKSTTRSGTRRARKGDEAS
jgi:integrase